MCQNQKLEQLLCLVSGCLLFVTIILATFTLTYAQCPEVTNWTFAWTDSDGSTTYTLEAPCKVYIDTPFNIIATVTDNTYQNNWVASFWAIKDNGNIISGSSGFNTLWTTNGQWQQVIEQTYTGTPVDHLIEFQFTDLGRRG